LEDQFVETVEEDEEVENESEDNRNSDVDAKLGGEDDTSSNWDPTDYGQPPETSSLVLLDSSHCRVPTQVMAKDGSKISCVCGKLTTNCKRHVEKIARGAYWGNIGHYVSMNDPARGFQGHGKLAFFYTPEQYQELRRKENAELATLLSAQQDNFSDGDDEAANLAHKARVSFGDSIEFLGVSDNSPVEVPAFSAETAHQNLEARTGGRTKQRKTASKQHLQPAKSPDLGYYGMEDGQEQRWGRWSRATLGLSRLQHGPILFGGPWISTHGSILLFSGGIPVENQRECDRRRYK
jgi:hypothetical protein